MTHCENADCGNELQAGDTDGLCSYCAERDDEGGPGLSPRASLFVAIIDGHGCGSWEEATEEVTQETLDDLERYLLIEKNVCGPQPPKWFTTHQTPDAAARYHVDQEYAADWEVVCLIDLDTGKQFTGTPRISWGEDEDDTLTVIRTLLTDTDWSGVLYDNDVLGAIADAVGVERQD